MENFRVESYEGVVILDDQGRVIEWNPAQEKITGISRKEAIGEYAWELFRQVMKYEETINRFRAHILSLLKSTENCVKLSKEIEIELHNSCGKGVRYVIINSFRISIEDKYYLGQIIRDITRQKLADLELEKYRTQLEQMVEERTRELIYAKEKAEESDKLKSAFLTSISHEIRTPIHCIVSFLQFIESGNISPKCCKEYINIINNSSSQLLKLIDNMIDMSKIEAKQMTLCPIPVQLNKLMNELRIFFETYLKSNNKEHIMLILDDSQFIDKCQIYVDLVRLRQILNNLIENAVKYTEKGYIRFGYRQSARDMLEFVVEDSGVGIPKSQQDIIFDHFRQAETGNERRLYGGIGLGLTILRSLVQMNGGEMWVKSKEGEGSSFYFTIQYIPVCWI